MDHHFAMGGFDGLADFAKQSHAREHGGMVVSAPGVKSGPFDVLHDEVGLLAGPGTAVEEAGDVRMFEGGEDRTFLPEALQHAGGARPGQDHFQGAALPEAVLIADGFVDGAHAAFANQADEAPVADGLAPEGGVEDGGVEGRDVGERVAEQVMGGGGIVVGEQGGDFRADGRVWVGGEESGTGAGSEFGSLGEERFDLGPAIVHLEIVS